MRSCCLSFLFASALLAFGGSLYAQTIDSIKGPTPGPLEPIEGIVEGPLPLGAPSEIRLVPLKSRGKLWYDQGRRWSSKGM